MPRTAMTLPAPRGPSTTHIIGLKAEDGRGQVCVTSLEGRGKFALSEEDRRLVVIVTHLGIAGG